MNWEETIISARSKPEFKDIIHFSYLNEDLISNVDRYRYSEEFLETISLIEHDFGKTKLKLLDIGSGNGISAISFALNGYDVTAVEPDPSITVGRGAIGKLAEHLNLTLQIFNGQGEKLPLPDQIFDIVYLRQTLHHASNIRIFLKECYRVLKKGGIIFTTRDHVIYNKKDKNWFLTSHPFHRFYGGENAYKKREYLTAFEKAGFKMIRIMGHFDSVINYYPLSKEEFHNYPSSMKEGLKENQYRRFGFLGKNYLMLWLYRCFKGMYPSWYNEKLIAGRMYSFIAIKK